MYSIDNNYVYFVSRQKFLLLSLKAKQNKENIIANKAACQALSHIGKIPIFFYLFHVNYISQINTLLPLIISVYIGTNLGKYILGFIPEKVFRVLFKTALFLISIKLIIFN